MKAIMLYRIASVLLVLFAAGHTFGFLKFKPPTAEGLAVRDAMNNVHFQVGGHFQLWGLLHWVWAEHNGLCSILRLSGLALGYTGREQSSSPRSIGLDILSGASGNTGAQLEVFFGRADDFCCAAGVVKSQRIDKEVSAADFLT